MIPTTKIPIWIKSEYVTMCITSSLQGRRRLSEAWPPPARGGANRRQSSAWVDYSILCRIWQDTGDGLPRRGFAPPRNDRTGDAGPLRPLRGHLPQGGRQGSVGFSGLVLAPPVGELAAELTERAGYGLPRRCAPRNDRDGGTDCRVGALPLLAMTGPPLQQSYPNVTPLLHLGRGA